MQNFHIKRDGEYSYRDNIVFQLTLKTDGLVGTAKQTTTDFLTKLNNSFETHQWG
jgi:hypothetical protein